MGDFSLKSDCTKLVICYNTGCSIKGVKLSVQLFTCENREDTKDDTKDMELDALPEKLSTSLHEIYQEVFL